MLKYKTMIFKDRTFTRIDNAVFDYLATSPKFRKSRMYLIPVYARLVHYVKNETMSCYVSQGRLAEETGWSRKTVIKALKILERNYLLKIKHRRKQRKTNIYTLILPEFLINKTTQTT
jgi:biotin operon repressor